MFKKFSHERRGKLIQKHQGTRSLGCVTGLWASEDSTCNMPGARLKSLEKKSEDGGAWGEMPQIFAQSECP